jgi:hypothetical protein
MADETWAGVLSPSNLKSTVFAGEAIAPTDWDTPLQTIINAVIAQVKQEIGCDVVKGTYTSEKVSGTGHSWLDLKHWPILTVTALTDVYGNTYTQGVTNDYTVEDFCLRSTGTWAKGHNNFVVSYTAGNAAIPPDIVMVCHELIAAKLKVVRFNLQGESSRNFSDGSVAFTSVDGGFTKAQLAVLNKYKRPRL